MTPSPTPATGLEITGAGTIAVPGGEASFSMIVKAHKPRQRQFTYSDPVAGISFKSKNATINSIVGNHGSFSGSGKIRHQGRLSYTVDAYDNGLDGDQFFIQLSNGYSAGSTLTSGSIQFHP
jgi:hypothetical protein